MRPAPELSFHTTTSLFRHSASHPPTKSGKQCANRARSHASIVGTSSGGLVVLPGRRLRHFSAKASSIAVSTSFSDGFTLGSKRAITSPFLLTRNLLKFHLILPANLGFVSLLVK